MQRFTSGFRKVLFSKSVSRSISAMWIVAMLCFLATLVWTNVLTPELAMAAEGASPNAPTTALTMATDGVSSNAQVLPISGALIHDFVANQMREGQVPGMMVVIVKDGQVCYSEGFGWADTKKKMRVDSETLFELASTSKAFTALAVLQLAKQGVLKVDDPVERYLPKFQVRYAKQVVQVTLRQLLHHTSGIPASTANLLPISDSPNALEKTAALVNGMELDTLPGTNYQYATINYDILGAIIEKVTGTSFEKYMAEHIFLPLGLNNTTLDPKVAQKNGLATGYRFAFGKTLKYAAPPYRGNKPAGYVISNGEDIAKWLNLQLGYGVNGTKPENTTDNGVEANMSELLAQSQAFDDSVAASNGAFEVFPEYGTYYSMGWKTSMKKPGQVFFHGGTNPTFSSYFILDKEQHLGVAVLSNLNTLKTYGTCYGIYSLLQGEEPAQVTDLLQYVDKQCSKAIYALTPIILLVGTRSGMLICDLCKGQREWNLNPLGIVIGAASLGGVVWVEETLRKLPIQMIDLSWKSAHVWLPGTASITGVEAVVSAATTAIFITLLLSTKKH